MSDPLVWAGQGPIRVGPASAYAVHVVTHTLLERHGTRWASVGSRARDATGAYGALSVDAISSRVDAPDAPMLTIAPALDPLEATLLPVIVQVLRAMESVPEPGWTAVVAGGGVRAEMLLALAPSCGARRTVRVTMENDPAVAITPADIAVAGSAERREELAALLRSESGPVVAFDVRGDVVAQLHVLRALPDRARLVLLDSPTAGGRASVDFYRHVHRKNTTVHGIPRVDSLDGGRCERGLRLLRTRVPERWQPRPPAVHARAGLDPGDVGEGLLLLVWPES